MFKCSFAKIILESQKDFSIFRNNKKILVSLQKNHLRKFPTLSYIFLAILKFWIQVFMRTPIQIFSKGYHNFWAWHCKHHQQHEVNQPTSSAHVWRIHYCYLQLGPRLSLSRGNEGGIVAYLFGASDCSFVQWLPWSLACINYHLIAAHYFGWSPQS